MGEGAAASAAALSTTAEVEALVLSLAALNLPALGTNGSATEEGSSCVPCPLPDEMLPPPGADDTASAERVAAVQSLTAGWTCPGKTCPGGNCLAALVETAQG